jgi:hypothetical protein
VNFLVNQKLLEEKSQQKEELLNQYESHQKLIEKISFFSKVRHDYLPLGENSKWITNQFEKIK